MTDTDNLDILPVGSVMPFRDKEVVPSNWEVLDGRTLDTEVVPGLAALWRSAPPEALEIWRQMGGDITDESIKLPNLRDREASQAMFGFVVGEPSMVLAIKAHRGVSSDANGSQVHSDDSAQGQPGQ